MSHPSTFSPLSQCSPMGDAWAEVEKPELSSYVTGPKRRSRPLSPALTALTCPPLLSPGQGCAQGMLCSGERELWGAEAAPKSVHFKRERSFWALSSFGMGVAKCRGFWWNGEFGPSKERRFSCWELQTHCVQGLPVLWPGAGWDELRVLYSPGKGSRGAESSGGLWEQRGDAQSPCPGF